MHIDLNQTWREFAKVVATSVLTIVCGVAHANAKPQRIVSLNLCVDQILIDLVGRERIAALSFLATDTTMSAIAGRAKSFHRVRGTAEGVLALDPDLVIAGAYSTPATRNLLQRLGKRVEVVEQPASVDGVRALVGKLAAVVGEPERGEEIIARFERDLQKATAGQNPATAIGDDAPTVLAIQVNNIVSMPGTLLNDAMRYAGLVNAGRKLASDRAGRVPLETLITAPPDVLALAYAPEEFRTVIADNLRHPVVKQLAASRPAVVLPMWSTLCGTPYITTAIERLARARQTVVQQRQPQ